MRIFLFFILLFTLVCRSATAETVKVTTRENSVRSDCRFYAPAKLKVLLGDVLTVKSRSGDWLQVSAKGISGCIHKSAVESRSFSAIGGNEASAGKVSAEEVSLAGKGFNPQVESGYRNSSNKLNYSAVDEIVSFKINEKDLESFVMRGGLANP